MKLRMFSLTLVVRAACATGGRPSAPSRDALLA